MSEEVILHLPNERRRRATAPESARARLEAWQAEEKHRARRGQAARRLQVVREGHERSADVGRSSDVHTPAPGRAGPVRAAETLSGVGFALALLFLIAAAFVAGLVVLLLALGRLIELGWKSTLGRAF